MVPLGRKRRIANRRERNVKIRVRRELAILRRIESPLQIVYLRTDVDATRERFRIVRATLGERSEGRKSREREIHLRRTSGRPIVVQLLEEAWRKIHRIEEAQE